MLLLIAVLVQVQRESQGVRQASRTVYLLLFVLFGVNQIIQIGATLWNSQAYGASHPAILQPPQNVRDYLAYGVLALFSIRVLAALRALSARRRRARRMNPERSSGAGEVAPPWQRAPVQNQR
jgi:hypothetical protein